MGAEPGPEASQIFTARNVDVTPRAGTDSEPHQSPTRQLEARTPRASFQVPPCDLIRHRRRIKLEELSERTTGRLGYIGPTMLREYVGRTTSRTTGRATGCTMDHATDRATQRCTQDQQPLLRHRAVGPADVQRWIHTYGDRGPAPLVRRK